VCRVILRAHRPPGAYAPGAWADRGRRVLALVKAFLRAGILTEQAGCEDTVTGTPQGGILSPLLANIALSALDEHFARAWSAMGSEWERRKRRARGESTFRLVRYADDFVVVLSGRRTHAEALVAELAAVLAPRGLALSKEKTRITHIDEGIEFHGWRIQRHRASNGRGYVYTYASKPSLAAVKAKVKAITPLRPQPDARPAAAPAQPGAAWLVRLLSRRGVGADLQLPARLQLAAGHLLAAPQTPRGELALAETALPPGVVADRRRHPALRPRLGADRVPPLPRGHDRHAVGAGPLPTRPSADARASADPGRIVNTGMSVESRMRGNPHVRFGGRPGETDRPQG
jgi:Reverse transcriptase (RNA-dependent DNA polymerase)